MSSALITQSRGVGRATATTDKDILMKDLGLGISFAKESKRLKALTDPEGYIEERMREQAKIGTNVLAVYTAQHARYLAMGYPEEIADLKAKEFARNVAALELKSVEEEYPELSSSSIMSANTGNAVRAYRGKKSKARRAAAASKASGPASGL